MGRDYRHESSIPAVSKGGLGHTWLHATEYVPPGDGLSESMPPEGKVRLLSESLARAFHDATFTEWERSYHR